MLRIVEANHRRGPMYMTYRMNEGELDSRFLRTLKAMFKGKEIEIVVSEAPQGEEDETVYLLRSPANRDRLLKAIENVAQHRNLVPVELDELH
jgi:antitoxin YefM